MASHILNYRYCVQPPVFACIMAVIIDSFKNFAETLKSHTTVLLIINIIININIRFCNITINLPEVKYIIIITIIIIIININIRSCNIIKICFLRSNRLSSSLSSLSSQADKSHFCHTYHFCR